MKFNAKQGQEATMLNHEGDMAFALSPPMELYTAIATAGLSDQFYEDSDSRLQRIRKLIAQNDAEFVARLAIYAREKMYMRSVPLLLAVELAKQENGNSLVSRLVARIVQRADEITELLACYANLNARIDRKQLNKLSKQLQKGLAEAFNKFDEYQFAKYNRDAKVKIKDALFLVHPKAKDETQQALFDKIVKDELQTPYTWEVELSALGQQDFGSNAQKAAAIRAKWEQLIFSNKLGYMATLRNLRNILEANVSNETLKKVCAYLAHADAVVKSKQMPFRFLSAYRELTQLKNGQTGLVLDALEAAIQCSAANISGFDAHTKVVLAADVSGSMQKAVSAKSKVQYFDIGLVLAMLLQSRCKHVISGMFGNTWKVITVPGKNILANLLEFRRREGEVGYSTNGYLVIRDLLDQKKVVDKVMMFTDCQLWNSNNPESISKLWKQYKQIAPGAKLYLFDLAGYGNAPLNILRDDVFLIAGWSDKIFDVLSAIENGNDALKLIDEISI